MLLELEHELPNNMIHVLYLWWYSPQYDIHFDLPWSASSQFTCESMKELCWPLVGFCFTFPFRFCPVIIHTISQLVISSWNFLLSRQSYDIIQMITGMVSWVCDNLHEVRNFFAGRTNSVCTPVPCHGFRFGVLLWLKVCEILRLFNNHFSSGFVQSWPIPEH